jgi:hypothetical protein
MAYVTARPSGLGIRPALLAVSRSRVRALARRCRLRSVPKGGVIFEEGQPPGLIETLALRDVTARVAPFPVDEARRAATDECSLLGTREDLGARLELCANW